MTTLPEQLGCWRNARLSHRISLTPPYADFAELSTERVRTDADICAWAAGVEQARLDQDIVWLVSATQHEIRRPRKLAMTHFFNHQTHHRGQVHAVLTYFGHDPGDTDLPLVLP